MLGLPNSLGREECWEGRFITCPVAKILAFLPSRHSCSLGR